MNQVMVGFKKVRLVGGILRILLRHDAVDVECESCGMTCRLCAPDLSQSQQGQQDHESVCCVACEDIQEAIAACALVYLCGTCLTQTDS